MTGYKNLTKREIKSILDGTIDIKLKDIDDNLILHLFVDKDTHKVGSKYNFCKNKNIIRYIENRYPKNEFVSLRETIRRILNKEERLPKCAHPDCDNVVKGFRDGRKYCSLKCFHSDEIVKEKKVQSIQNKFGKEFTNCSQVPEIKKKKEKTIQRHYGKQYKNPSNVPEIKEKIQNNIKKSNLERYGVECTFSVPEIRAKAIDSMIDRYGVPYNVYREEYWDKYYKSRIKNGTSRTLENKKDLRSYAHIARFITGKVYIEFKALINPDNKTRSKDKNHLDHKFSIVNGFDNNIDIEKICMPYNLCIIPAKENERKHTNSSISIGELNSLFEKFKKNKKLYSKYRKILKTWIKNYD